MKIARGFGRCGRLGRPRHRSLRLFQNAVYEVPRTIFSVRDEYPRDRSDYLTNPKKLIVHAQRNNEHAGSATLVLVTLDPARSLLQTAYVGDSGYAIFRQHTNGTVFLVNKFTEQLHGFNFPFQLAR